MVFVVTCQFTFSFKLLRNGNEGSFRLSYNGSMFAREGLGYLLTFEHLIDTSVDSGLEFRPLSPKLENRLFLIWKKYQTFSPIAERFLKHLQVSFTS